MQRDLGTSSATLQVAFDRLVEQGYIRPRHARGTFVAETLPNRSAVGLVFPDEPTSRNWNRLYAAIQRVAKEWTEGDTRFRVYTIPRERQDSLDHHQLCADIADGGLAGLVFVNSPFYLKGSPILRSNLPRVCINGSNVGELEEYGYSLVNVSDGGIRERIFKYFRDVGCRRMAVLANLGGFQQFKDALVVPVKRAGLEIRSSWWLGLPIDSHGAASARAVVALLLDREPRDRPDCLFIADDNLVPHATAGVIDAGLQAGCDIRIAAHANHPVPTFAAVRCLRFGADLVAQLRTALAELSVLAAGGRPQMIEVPFVLSEEQQAT